MSTRGSLGFIINGEVNLFFNHFDSYPTGKGNDILKFISLSNVEYKWEIYKKHKNILISDLNLNFDDISPNNDFIKNSLFCEYAYIINLDDMILEFYVGFQKTPQLGNRFGVEKSNEIYYPCRLVSIFDINTINDFIDISKIVDKMNYLVENDIDDSSIVSHFRKLKLQKINEKTSQ